VAGAAISGAISAAAYADWIEKSRKQLSRHTWLFLAINDAVLPERLSNGRTDIFSEDRILGGKRSKTGGGAGSSETKGLRRTLTDPRPLFPGVHLQIPTMAITDAMALLKWPRRVDGSRRTSTETSCRTALSASKLGNKRPAARVFERLSNNRGVEHP
jgi:hypothetical protein